MTHEEIRERMCQTLSPKRFEHVLGVVDCIEYLAEKSGVDREKAVTAALLHDATKPWTVEEHLEWARLNSLSLSDDDISSPEVLHSRTGALLSRLEYGCCDEVYRAIFCHTTGKADMTYLEMILFVADFIEKTRAHASCIEERERLSASLEKISCIKEAQHEIKASTLRILENTVSYLSEKKVFIHSDTHRAIDFLKSRGEL